MLASILINESMATRHRQRAFSLVELMVAIAIVAITISYGIPRFNTAMANNRSLALGESLTGALQYARAEAIKQAKLVTLCPAGDGDSCATDGWSGRGWLVIRDAASDETSAATSTASVLKRWDKLSNSERLTIDNDRKFIRFNSLGMLARVEGVDPVIITTRTTGCTGTSARTININLSGMIGVVKTDC